MKKAITLLTKLVSLALFLTLFIITSYPAINAKGTSTSPSKQVEEGKAPEEVECKEGLKLIIRSGGNPACVKPETAKKLIERGMAQYPIAPPAVAEESDTEPADARTFVIVPEESKASYIVDEEFLDGALDKLEILPGPVTAVGTTQQVEGHLQLNANDLTDPQVLGPNSFTVNIESLTSDDDRRDDRIKRTQFGVIYLSSCYFYCHCY